MQISENLLSKLKDPSLLTDYIRMMDKWNSADGGETDFEVINPSTGELVAVMTDMTRAEAVRAIDAAYIAQKTWAKTTGKARAAVLRRLYDLMVANADDLATVLTMEMGKPLREARSEISYGAAYVEWFGEEAKRLYGDTIPGHEPGTRILVLRQPIGVVAAITPWNFPNAMLARKVAPAIAAGCAVISKPAAETPLSAMSLAVLADRAGLPEDLFNIVVSTDAQSIGKEFTENEKVRKLSFTGSTEVGRTLMRQGADKIIKLGLELGGNAPFIVFDDADIDAAVEGAMVSKYRNNGQTCVCSNRFYVQSEIHDAFAERLAKRVATMKVGDGFEANVDTGPLINSRALAKIETLVADAISKGAQVIIGGKKHTRGGLFFEPTVLANATTNMLVAREEIFGPIATLFKFDTECEVIELANNSKFGLASYFYAKDVSRIFRVAEALEFGMVGINTGSISTEVAPFGGIKQSGMGREGSKYGMEDYTELKYLCLALQDDTRDTHR